MPYENAPCNSFCMFCDNLWGNKIKCMNRCDMPDFLKLYEEYQDVINKYKKENKNYQNICKELDIES